MNGNNCLLLLVPVTSLRTHVRLHKCPRLFSPDQQLPHALVCLFLHLLEHPLFLLDLPLELLDPPLLDEFLDPVHEPHVVSREPTALHVLLELGFSLGLA